ncbi:unnamed protein product [Caenorhabditis sp. 36 PRJEB53466]|nr:unnamed protein product [Caenorhabditis sp. 36 PRJEB53466]
MAWFLFYHFAIEASKVVFASTVLINLLLIYMTIKYTKRITGVYKYMIILFAAIGILFTFMKATLHPYLHSHNCGIVFFSLEADWGKFKQVEVALMIYTGVYSAMISLVAIQFVFRYWILFCNENLKYFNTWRCIFWFGYVLLIGMGWSFMIYLCAPSDRYSRNYMRESLFDTYGMDVERTVGFFVVVYNEDHTVRWHNVAFIAGLLFDLIIQYVIVIYCGTTMNQKMNEKLASFSVAHRRLQEQLFRTLVLQITIPSIIFHLPFIPVLCAPLFRLDFDFESGMIYCLFSLYPPIDSGILMFVVHDYRHAIINTHWMESQLGNVEIYPPSPQPPPAIGRIRRGMLFDIPWIIILIQFIVILALVLGLFAFFLTRTGSSVQTYSTRTYQSFELQTMSPSSSPLTFRRRYKTTSESPQEVDFDFSEDVAPTEERVVTIAPTTKFHHSTLLEAANSVEVFEHDESLRAAVFTVSQTCSELGKSILVRGGNAVDAAIAASFCLMGAAPNKASLAGGMVMTVKSKTGNATTIMARESAPLNTDVEQLQKHPELAQVGAKAVGTPGVLNGLFRAYQKFTSNSVPFKQLVLPTIQQCIRGFELPEDLKNVSRTSALSSFFKANQQNDKLFCGSLAATLTEISEYENPLEAFYHGEMAQKLVKELGGYLTVSDLEDYESDVNAAICTEIDTDTKLCGPGPPSLFAVLANTYLATKNMSNLDKVNEVVRSSVGLAAKIADPMFAKSSKKYAEELAKTSKRNSAEIKESSVNFTEDGSTEVLVIDENNMTVSVTLSLGDDFGNLFYSSSGFFWNNKMRYFDLKNQNVPLSLQPGKVPTSLAAPIIVVKYNSVGPQVTPSTQFNVCPQVLAVSGGVDFLGLVHLLREITHRNYDSSKVAPSLFVQNSAVSLKSPSNKYSITGY